MPTNPLLRSFPTTTASHLQPHAMTSIPVSALLHRCWKSLTRFRTSCNGEILLACTIERECPEIRSLKKVRFLSVSLHKKQLPAGSLFPFILAGHQNMTSCLSTGSPTFRTPTIVGPVGPLFNCGGGHHLLPFKPPGKEQKETMRSSKIHSL